METRLPQSWSHHYLIKVHLHKTDKVQLLYHKNLARNKRQKQYIIWKLLTQFSLYHQALLLHLELHRQKIEAQNVPSRHNYALLVRMRHLTEKIINTLICYYHREQRNMDLLTCTFFCHLKWVRKQTCTWRRVLSYRFIVSTEKTGTKSNPHHLPGMSSHMSLSFAEDIVLLEFSLDTLFFTFLTFI